MGKLGILNKFGLFVAHLFVCHPEYFAQKLCSELHQIGLTIIVIIIIMINNISIARFKYC